MKIHWTALEEKFYSSVASSVWASGKPEKNNPPILTLNSRKVVCIGLGLVTFVIFKWEKRLLVHVDSIPVDKACRIGEVIYYVAVFSWHYCRSSVPCSQVGPSKLFWGTQYTEMLFTTECTMNERDLSSFLRQILRIVFCNVRPGNQKLMVCSKIKGLYPLERKMRLSSKLPRCFYGHLISALIFNSNPRNN